MPRDRQPEVMDQPGLDPAEHVRALQGLRRINGISRCVPGLFRHFEKLASESPTTQLSVLSWLVEVVIRQFSSKLSLEHITSTSHFKLVTLTLKL